MKILPLITLCALLKLTRVRIKIEVSFIIHVAVGVKKNGNMLIVPVMTIFIVFNVWASQKY
jgi:hypothetical protein